MRKIAAEAARKEVREATLGRSSPIPTASPRERVSSSIHYEGPRQRTSMASSSLQRTPSPRPQTPMEIRSPSTLEYEERPRVIHDTLKLMTVERLQQALRFLGMPVTGLKADLIERLSVQLGHQEPGAGSTQPTTKQLKFVLCLWRKRDLQGRVVLTWDDVATRSAISDWIHRHKEEN